MGKKSRDEKIAEMEEGVITEEALELHKSLIGKKVSFRVFNSLASKDAVAHFVDGIGDLNPLYRSEKYAKKTRYGRIPAPPNWLYSVFPTWPLPPVYIYEKPPKRKTRGASLTGVHGFHAGNDWEFYFPVLEGDTINAELIFEDVKVTQSKFSGKIVWDYLTAYYYNQRGQLVAKAKSWAARSERKAAREKGKYFDIKLPHPWSEEQLEKLDDEVLNSASQIRGSNILYWENVRTGDELLPLVKGPFGLTDVMAWCVGASPVPLLAHAVALTYYKRHPAWRYRDPITYASEPIYSVHYNIAAAKTAGLPFPYDVGAQRNCWLIQLFTNSMGDEGWLKTCNAKYTKFFYFSDAVWIKGKVVRKYVDERGEHCVDVECHAINQRNEDIMPAYATVILPSIEDKEENWPVAKRLRALQSRD